uniref:Uncharacterized protein n=1 Tax=Callorhinchus milii TaxID=7868 RepID=A0A4W3H6Y3_CALMI
IPIWSMMCCQFCRHSRSTLPSINQLTQSGIFMIVVAMRAPFMGGLEYMGRIRIFSWDSTRFASSTSLQTTVKAPMFLP